MKNIILAMLFIASCVVSCQPRPKDDDKEIVKEETRQLPSFTGISVSESIKMTIQQGSTNQMNIRTERVDVSDVITKVSDGKLKIFVDEEDLSFWFFQRWSGDIEIDLIYTENLEHVSVSGSASLESKSLIDSEEVELYVSNSGYADIDIRSNDLEVEVSNSGKADVRAESRSVRATATNSARLNLSGKSEIQEYWISNSSKILASEMQSQKTQIDATNSAYSEIYVVEELIATANNSATIKYNGNPEKVQSNAGQSGQIKSIN